MVAAVIDRYSMGQIDASEAPSQARLALAIAVAIEVHAVHADVLVAIRPMEDPLWERPNGAVVLDPRSDARLISSLVRVGFLSAGRL